VHEVPLGTWAIVVENAVFNEPTKERNRKALDPAKGVAKEEESLFLLRRHFGNWPRGPAVSMRSELLVAHEKLGQLLLYVVPV